MTIRNLEGLLAPKSLALIGPNSHGALVLERLLLNIAHGGFKGPRYMIGLEQSAIAAGTLQNYRSYKSLEEMSDPLDLVVLLCAASEAPKLLQEAGKKGCRAALLPASGFDGWDERDIDALLAAAQPFNIRILGPGSLGVAAPHCGLSALLTLETPKAGELALISRSGTIFNATLSWAQNNGIGFSAAISLGRRADVDVSDLLDYFAMDFRSKAILLHLETIRNPRKFLSAARAAARVKPVIVIRSGASRDRPQRGITHSGRLATPDAVYDAALQRAGVLRVHDLDEMFEAVETVTRVKPPQGQRLAILANGRSLATLAADHWERLGGELAAFGAETQARLNALTRVDSAGGNPLVLPENASTGEFSQALDELLQERSADGVLVVAAPTAFNDYEGIAKTIAEAGKKARKGMGRRPALIATLASGSAMPRQALDEAKVPCFASPSDAVRSFMHLVRYQDAQRTLMSAPDSLPRDFNPQLKHARRAVQQALESGQQWLTPLQIRDLLGAYGIQQVEMYFARTLNEVQEAAKAYLRVYSKLVLKICSPQLIFKSDVGGVQLDLDTPGAAREAARQMLERFAKQYPQAQISGFELQPQIDKLQALETYAGLANDAVFGPVVLFGRGGTSVEVVKDRAIDLVPLDLNLARSLIERSGARPLLDGFRNRPPADQAELARLLVKLSQISLDFPEVVELDLNPVVADANGLMVLDARVAIAPAAQDRRSLQRRLPIAPYPREWEHTQKLKDGREIFIRPVRPEDQALFKTFFQSVSQEDLRLRFFAPVKEFSHAFLARLVQLDYTRAMAFAAFDKDTDNMLGVVRLHCNPDHTVGEYAVMVQSELKGLGLGWMLMQLILRYAQVDGIATVKGEVLRENTTMLAMCRKLGFSSSRAPDDDSLSVVTLDVEQAEHDFLLTGPLE